MGVVFEQVFTLFLFGAAGYALSRFGIVSPAQSKILSSLLVYVFLPANIFRTFSTNCTIPYLTQNYRLVLTSAAVLLLMAVGMHFLARAFSKDPYERRVYEYSLIISNYGYMGYAMAESVLGAVGLMNMMMYAIPTALYTYSVGFCSLTKRPLTLKKLINPVLIAVLAGIIVGLCGIPLPSVATTVLTKASACMAPLSMLMAGIVISEFPLKELLCEKRTYIMTALRLFVIPLSIGGLLVLVGLGDVAKTAILMYAMPCGLNTIIFPKIVGENCKIGAGLAFVSNVLACISIPLVFAVFGIG